MKRIIIVFIIVFSIISNLSAQDSKTINGTILEKKNINNHTLVSKKHEQKLTLDYSASDYQLILYNDSIEKKKIADLQRKQEITIKEIVFLDEKENPVHHSGALSDLRLLRGLRQIRCTRFRRQFAAKRP